MAMTPTQRVENFWRYVDKQGPCWLWVGGPRPSKASRYGKFYNGERQVFAHRYMYELVLGPIPEGQVVLHSCDNGYCVNPAHLSLGTQKENMQDCARKGRRNVRGGRNPKAKLTAEQVAEIRVRLANGETHRPLAKEYGVHKTAVSFIASGRTWKEVG